MHESNLNDYTVVLQRKNRGKKKKIVHFTFSACYARGKRQESSIQARRHIAYITAEPTFSGDSRMLTTPHW